MDKKRRPIKARESSWAGATARLLKNLGLTPNAISIMSMFFAGLAGLCFLLSRRAENPVFLLLGAVFVQMRLLCNLFDGMVAVEGGLKTKSGEIFNDAPDRPADIFILLGLGFAVSGVSYGAHLGWAASLLAVLTAYVRNLGVSAGASPTFFGPMAKQHRMATVTAAAIAGFFERTYHNSDYVLQYALWIVIVGSLITCLRRLRRIVNELEGKF